MRASIQTPLTFSSTVKENLPWGDSIKNIKNKTTRIYFQNINGVQPSQKQRWPSILRNCIQHNKCDIIGFCETGLNWAQKPLSQNIQSTSYRTQKIRTHISHSQNSATSPTSFLPGGTMLLTQGHWIGRMTKHLNDPEKWGRWSGTQDRSLFIITAYRPCINSLSEHAVSNSNSTYAQQFHALRKAGVSAPDPRQQVILDLFKYVTQLDLQQKDMLLIMLDANESLGTDNTGISHLTTSLGLIDLFPRYHQSKCKIATQSRGSERIDFMFGSPNILPHIVQCGYLSFNQDIESDH